MKTAPLLVGLVASAALANLVACEDDKKERLINQTAGEAAAPVATPPPPASTAAAASAAPSASASADMKRFDPKYKCPTGQTHFYLEGDFCRRKCFTNGDCSKGERCSTKSGARLLPHLSPGSSLRHTQRLAPGRPSIGT